MTDLSPLIQQTLSTLSVYQPIGYIGLWRWCIWLFKRSVATFYSPVVNNHKAKVSIVTPVYNEDPEVFKKALDSWVKEKPSEIIAVIDHSDLRNIEEYTKFSKKHKFAKMIVTQKPGKRPALADGILQATSEIVALVDCDTIWTPGTLKNSIAPFSDKEIGGVATRQNVLSEDSAAQVIFDIQLDQRYSDELPFLGAAGHALTCLSGRTAFYRREVVLPMLDDLVTEYFLGKKVISGDDKRLTYLVQAAGWKTAYQGNAVVLTEGTTSLRTFFKQRIRWGRNTWRADLRAVYERWVFRHPALAFFILDRFIQPFTLLLGLMYFINSLIFGHYLVTVALFVWWIVSRVIKLYPHLKRYPKDIVWLPVYIFVSYYLAILKLYSLVTLNSQGWITRWDKSRLRSLSFIQNGLAYLGTFAIVLGIWFFSFSTYSLKGTVIANNPSEKFSAFEKKLMEAKFSLDSKRIYNPVLKRHVVKEGEYLADIAAFYNVDLLDILNLNYNILPNWNRIESGLVLTIPTGEIPYTPPVGTFNYERRYFPPLEVFFVEETNTLMVRGRGNRITLPDLAALDGFVHIKEVEPKTWLLTSNLVLENGVVLDIAGENVNWLKLQSNKDNFVTMIFNNNRVTFDGVRVTSWDTIANDFDRDFKDGRSYILSKGNGRLDIYNSDFSYLGYKHKDFTVGGTYGVSWRIPSDSFGSNIMTGEVLNSKFHNNYFGVYTYGATGMVFKNNKFYENIQYGFDPHDDSNNFLVDSNEAYNNGNHGFIFSKRCYGNILVNNISKNNKLHGIMLHADSNNNFVYNNIVEGNLDGIAIWGSNNNEIANNLVKNNKRGIRVNYGSKNNSFVSNELRGSTQYGFYFYDGAVENKAIGNILTDNLTAFYVKSSKNLFENNLIFKAKNAFFFMGDATNNIMNLNYAEGVDKVINDKTDTNASNVLGSSM